MKTTQENIFSSKTLSYFLQLADTMNYTQAAQILGITQPALTQQIKKLERTVGTPLFYSVGKKLKLSDAGITMLRTTHEIYDLLNEATDEIQQATSSNIGEINLGILSSIETKVIEDFTIELYKHNPDLVINTLMLNRKEIWEHLENNKIDLAIMYLPDESIKNWKPYSSKKIVTDDLMFIHHNENYKNRNKIKLNDSKKHPWVIYPREYYLNTLLHESFKNCNIDFPKVAARYTNPDQILKFAISTQLNTVLPKSYILGIDKQKLSDQHTWITEFDPKIKFDLSFVYRNNKNQIPRIKNFLDRFDAFLKEEDYFSRLEK